MLGGRNVVSFGQVSSARSRRRSAASRPR